MVQMLKFGTIFILASTTTRIKNKLINNLKMNFYEQKHQNRIDFTSAWFSIRM
jgi:hypothetical protein